MLLALSFSRYATAPSSEGAYITLYAYTFLYQRVTRPRFGRGFYASSPKQQANICAANRNPRLKLSTLALAIKSPCASTIFKNNFFSSPDKVSCNFSSHSEKIHNAFRNSFESRGGISHGSILPQYNSFKKSITVSENYRLVIYRIAHKI